jgi:MFS transporter, FHS family, L-fucose permease
MPTATRRSALYTLISVFFFWGFVAASNTILIPLFKESFALTQAQSQLVDYDIDARSDAAELEPGSV